MLLTIIQAHYMLKLKHLFDLLYLPFLIRNNLVPIDIIIALTNPVYNAVK